MTPADMARIHAAAMLVPRPWSASEIADLLATGAFGVAGDHAFAIGRVTLDEAELLTLATDPAHQRQGHARATLAAYHAGAAQRGARASLLEVAADNGPARTLYAHAGYREVGRRRGYYLIPGSSAVDALILRRALQPVS